MRVWRKILKGRVVMQLLNRESFAVRSNAARVLATVIKLNKRSRDELEAIASLPGLLEGVVALLSLDEPADTQWRAIQAFNVLAVTREGRERLVAVSRALENVVNLFSRTTDRHIQLRALLGFTRLVIDTEIRPTMISTPGVLSSLADLTYRDLPDIIKFRAALLLLYLSATKDVEMGFFRTAVRSLATVIPDTSVYIKRRIARILLELTKIYSEERMAIMAYSSDTFFVLSLLMYDTSTDDESEEMRKNARAALSSIRSVQNSYGYKLQFLVSAPANQVR